MRRTADPRLQGRSDPGHVKDQALRTPGRAWSLWSPGLVRVEAALDR